MVHDSLKAPELLSDASTLNLTLGLPERKTLGSS